ncbi:MAG: peptidase S41 [Balneolaceae bacterium]|nr:MAG: peptidase S41 [Balneolaceae bacterium]
MKTIFHFLILFFLGWSLSFAQDDPRWIRYQAISPDGNHIVFTYKGDLYRVSTEGGTAQQLTFHEAHDFMPVWSNDGEKIAFASDRYGNFNVYVMDALGGPATRLTYHSNNEYPYGFTYDNENVLFGAVRQDLAEHRQFPSMMQPELYSVPVNGGRVNQIFTIPAEYSRMSRDGNRIIYHDKKGYENEWRKHQRSAIARDIWLYNAENETHSMLTTFEGENRQPVFNTAEDAIYYLSEQSGSFNVHKMSLSNPGQIDQVTFFSGHPVRFLSYGNGTLAFGYDGELYTMREGSEPEKINVIIRTQEKRNPDRFITIDGDVQEMAVSPNGKEIAFIARGEVFVTSVDGSLTKRITNTPERERFVTFTPDGKGVVYAALRDGRWSIFKTTKVREEEPFFYGSTLLQEHVLVSGDEDKYMPAVSPDGKKLAYIAGRRTLRVRDLDSGSAADLLTPDDLFHMQDGDQYFVWSPDSRWLLVGWRKLLHNAEVLLISADGSERINLTESGYYDLNPKWVNKGKQMIWFSNRDGLRSYAASGVTERDIYTMFFDQEEWDKFNLSEEDYKLYQQIAEARESEREVESNRDAGILDFAKERMKDWTARLTIHSGRISDAVLSKGDSTLYYLASFEQNYNLWKTNLRTRETSMAIRLNTQGGSLVWDKEKENLYLLRGGKIQKLDVSAGSATPVRISGEMMYDAEKEREYMLEQVYVRTKNVFYEPTFHGNDWNALYEEYQKYLPHIGNSYEFAEMVSEMLGELNVSHAGASFSRTIENPDQTASLGIFMDYEHQDDGIRITEVIQGGPLDKAAFDMEPGMIIEKIDGITITSDRDKASFLNRKADKFVLLDILSPDGSRKQITVKPVTLAQERDLLYRRFIRINEMEVDEKSNGRLGYVHIPGMSDGPYRYVIREMLGKYSDREAVIVDGRFNSGGDLVADLAMFFTGEPFNTYATADKDVGGEPTSRWTKPTLSIINEGMYSDGHCYASAYSELEIGLTVGMPVPGTCSFGGWEMLPDGTRWGVVPISARNMADEWMENNQTEPMIMVRNEPGVIDRGRDQQLEKAIEALLDQISGNE